MADIIKNLPIVGEEAPREPGALKLGVTKDGDILMTLGQPMDVIGFTPLQAMELASGLLNCATTAMREKETE